MLPLAADTTDGAQSNAAVVPVNRDRLLTAPIVARTVS